MSVEPCGCKESQDYAEALRKIIESWNGQIQEPLGAAVRRGHCVLFDYERARIVNQQLRDPDGR